MRALVLEDDAGRINEFKQRFLERGWVGRFATTAREAVLLLREQKFDYVFLDHDLGERVNESSEAPGTGAEVARWWQDHEHPNKRARVVIHSFNTSGAEYMAARIYGSVRLPGAWVKPTFARLDEPQCSFWDSDKV